MTVIAIDPGKASGVAHYFEDSGKFDSTIYTFEQMLDNFIPEMYQFQNSTMAVICEDYIVTQRTITASRQNFSLELIGALRYETRRLHIPFILQTPAQAKSFATDEKLKKLGWYKKGTAGHDLDAARHMLVFLVNQEVIKPEELI